MPKKHPELLLPAFRQRDPDLQVFYENHCKLVHQLASPLVLVVVTLLEDVLVNLLQPHDRFATTLGTLLAACYTTLRTAQLLLRLTVQTRVLDGAAIRQHGERGQPNVDTNGCFRFRQRL